MPEVKKPAPKENKARKPIAKKSVGKLMKLKKKKARNLTMAKVQIPFNAFIRRRDCVNGFFTCISCNNVFPADKCQAGHYISAGSSSFLRFDPHNVHGQCGGCNTFRHGNLIEYRIGLIKKIGLENVEWLEQHRHDLKKWSQEELRVLRECYRNTDTIENKIYYESRIKKSEVFT